MKVGDIFHMSWGYDQTNNTFFRVKALRGKTQAVIQEVELGGKCISSGFMSGDYVYDVKDWKISDNSVFVKDNTKGRIVKIQDERWGDPQNPLVGFYIDRHFCELYKGNRVYESWYA